MIRIGDEINKGSSLRAHVAASAAAQAGNGHERSAGREHEIEVLCSGTGGLEGVQEVTSGEPSKDAAWILAICALTVYR